MKRIILVTVAALGLSLSTPMYASFDQHQQGSTLNEDLQDSGSSIGAKRIAVVSAKLAVGTKLLSIAAVENGQYKLAAKAGVVSFLAKKLCVASVLAAAEGVELTPEARERIKVEMSEFKSKVQEVKDHWNQMTEEERAPYRETFKDFKDMAEHLRSRVQEVTQPQN